MIKRKGGGGVREISYTAGPEDDGRRLSRLVRSGMGVSAHLYASLKRREAVLVNGEPARADRIVRAGERVSLLIEDETSADPAEPAETALRIVYEDDDVIVIDKPAPLSCMRGLAGDNDSLESRALWHYRGTDFVFRPVNRLDKGTSGLMALARHAHAQQLMQNALHTPRYVREYLAVTDGIMARDEGIIDAPIAKADGATVRREVRPDGKRAVTRFWTVTRGQGVSLVRLRLDTGRTHQIRVHLASLGHPVTGDFLYGREDDRLRGRFALHACFLSLDHPITGEKLSFTSPPPDVFGEILRGGALPDE